MIYLDNAATSFPKPLSVSREVDKCIKSYCGNPGRGAHSLSRISSEKVYETREILAELFGSHSPENVVFTYNDTYALNMVIKGLLHKGDHVLISDMEHNSVYRPVAMLAEKGLISYDIFDTMCLSSMRTSERICANIRRLIRPETRMLICTHVSNICSAELPLQEIGALCRARGIIFVVDAAQSAGHLSINMEEMKIDALCAPGHKGLFGLQGSGFAILGENVLPYPLTEGGSGVNSLSISMPSEPPERYEAGTLSVPCIASLCEGAKFVRQRGTEDIRAHESALCKRLLTMLSSLPHLTLYAEDHIGSTVLFNLNDIPSERVADMLDGYGICVRSGFHCSPLGHKVLQTGANGAVRVSFGTFNTMKELDTFYLAIKNIIKGVI